MKKVFILRSVPGAGKSTIAEQYVDFASMGGLSSIVCCADDYFMVDGEYIFDVEKIGTAHVWCQKMFKDHLLEGTDVIVVANTSTRTRDVNYYRELAITAGYQVFVITVENWHSGKDTHNVPQDVKEKMSDQLRKSIKLTANG